MNIARSQYRLRVAVLFATNLAGANRLDGSLSQASRVSKPWDSSLSALTIRLFSGATQGSILRTQSSRFQFNADSNLLWFRTSA